MTPAQCRAGRALLDMSQQQLADMAGVTSRALGFFEAQRVQSQRATVAVIRSALEQAGVRFTDAGGVEPIGGAGQWRQG